MFQGYSDATADFLWGIRFNNDRTWFEAHKEEYLQHLYQPTQELGREVYDRFTPLLKKPQLDLHVSRIYRDARRLHGRGPYKDHLWFSLRRNSDLWLEQPVFWFEITPEGCSYGMGFWNPRPETMAALRRDIDQGSQTVTKLARRLAKQDVFQLEGRDYARAKGDPSPLLTPWYNKRELSIGCERGFDELLCSPALVDTLVEGYQFLTPYFRYFDQLCR